MKKTLLVLLACMQISLLNAKQVPTEEEEAMIWSKHFYQMVVPLGFLTEDALTFISENYEFGTSTANKLRHLCYERERRKYLYNYMEISPIDRYRCKERIDSIYQDSINVLLIPTNLNISGSLISLAIGMSDHFKMDSLKYQSLMNKALEFARQRKLNPCCNFAKEEMDFLKETLDKEQVERVININNIDEARFRAINVWNVLSDKGLLEYTDSIEQVSRAFSFFRRELFIYDYYTEQPELIENNLRDLNMRKPQIIRMYEGLLSKERVKQRHQKKIGVEFAW